MDNLLHLAQKFDALYRPDLRRRLIGAIEERTEISPTDQAAIDQALALGDQIKESLGARSEEFETRFSALIEKHQKFPWPAEALVRALTSDAAEPLNRKPLRMGASGSLYRCGCSYDGHPRIVVCDFHASGSTPETMK